jgi:predicted O-linked N-acetylglucosamine transferase (SPINDLY family)
MSTSRHSTRPAAPACSAAESFRRGVAHQSRGKLAAAIGEYHDALRLDPEMAAAHHNLGTALHAAGDAKGAVTHLKRAIELQPELHDALVNLADVYEERKQLPEAVELLQRAIRLRPGEASTHHRLGIALMRLDRVNEAAAALDAALRLAPEHPGILGDAGTVALLRKRYDDAIRLCTAALERDGSLAAVANSLANCYKDQGRLAEALEMYRRALRHAPTNPIAWSNLLLAQHYVPDLAPAEILATHREMERALTRGIIPSRRHANDRDPARRLRVGYLSPDFRNHSVAYYVEALLRHHDRTEVEVVCFSDCAVGDEVTGRLRDHADAWFDTFRLSDAQLAELVAAERIDILVDLAGHTRGGRPLVFARRPAPLQVTYIGYPGTTGFSAMDYRVTDAVADPPGRTEAFHSETLVRLDGGFLCYTPPADAPDVAPPPSLAGRPVTFGSFNLVAKVNDGVLRLWARLLRRVPDSRLLLKARSLDADELQARIRAVLADAGVAPERVELHGQLPRKEDHLGFYAKVDVALDPFPYNGTTTTCEALWMGVPVVTLAGEQHAGRVGASLLTALRREEWIASSEEEYVDIAAGLAASPERLAALRFALRRQMERTPLMDPHRVTRALESAYRAAWRAWCRAPAEAPARAS